MDLIQGWLCFSASKVLESNSDNYLRYSPMQLFCNSRNIKILQDFIYFNTTVLLTNRASTAYKISSYEKGFIRWKVPFRVLKPQGYMRNILQIRKKNV